MARVRVDLDQQAIIKVASRTSETAAEKIADRLVILCRSHAPSRTGRLRVGIKAEKTSGGVHARFEVRSTAPYSRYQEKGTGPIFARPGGVLAWPAASMNNPFGAGMVFAKSTRGVPATHFMEKGFNDLNLRNTLT